LYSTLKLHRGERFTLNSTEGVADPTARRYNEIHSHKDGNSRNLLANEIYVNQSHISTMRGLIKGAFYVKRADGIRSLKG